MGDKASMETLVKNKVEEWRMSLEQLYNWQLSLILKQPIVHL